MDKKTLRIGTRDSELALWQAKKVQQLLNDAGHDAELVPVKSSGDLDLVTPLYAMGVQGVFTKNLDAHLLSGYVDIAVHSMKDVPTQLAQGLAQAAILPRAASSDILVLKPEKWHKADTGDGQWIRSDTDTPLSIATGSVRRKAQWLHRYPDSRIDNLRGNVQTRLRKLQENDWDGAIFAAAGLDRVGLLPDNHIVLDWMLPAPAQGAIMVVCREEEDLTREICAEMNDAATAACVKIERDFLSTLMGGCSTPIGAYAYPENGEICFKGNIFSPDGKHALEIEERLPISESHTIGTLAAKKLLAQGAGKIIEEIKRFEKGN